MTNSWRGYNLVSGRAYLIAMLAVSLVGCVSVPGVSGSQRLSMSDIVANHETLDGKTVRTVGWLRNCLGRGCSITESSGGAGASLSLGTSGTFDRTVAPYRGIDIQIEVEGKVNRECFDHRSDPGADQDAINVCMDRGNEIDSPTLIRILQTRAPTTEEGD